jgi:hypothetical protein
LKTLELVESTAQRENEQMNEAETARNPYFIGFYRHKLVAIPAERKPLHIKRT